MFTRVLAVILLAVVSCTADGALRMPFIFQSGMVLQRDKETAIWGFGHAGDRVVVKFLGLEREDVADKNTRWQVSFPAQPAGGPYVMVIIGDSNTIELTNILFGDVWICGGQSNMQFSLDEIGYLPEDTAAIVHSQIRLFTVPVGMDYIPRLDLAGGKWEEATAATIKKFSATAWFYGKFLHDSLNVPIGLISDNLFATSLETWMSPEGLSKFPQFASYCLEYLDPGISAAAMDDAFNKSRKEWEDKYYLTGKGLKEKWFLPETDISDWDTMEIPAWWEEHGLAGFDGAVWFRRNFDLPDGFAGDSMLLTLNQIDDYDIAWVNGQKIGEGWGNQNWRKYNIPTGILKPKDNVLVIRVFDAGGRGGMYTHAIWGNEILVGRWVYTPDTAIDATTFPKPKVVNMSPFSTPAVLYNANIAPLTSLSVKGFIWYQGESNISRASEYKVLFPAFISDWRERFGQGDLPFLFVQLANFMQEDPQPAESKWAELREAQSASLALKNTGMAVTIDIGETNNIHPRNKMDVGKRLGLAALNVAYYKNLPCTGPVYESAEVKGDRITVHFKKGTDRLITKDKYGYVRGFAIAGKDRKYQWAKAFIDGGTITVFSENVKEPVAVRYAWSDNPGSIDLYNSNGLPAAPFRTDNWPLVTEGRVYSENPWEIE